MQGLHGWVHRRVPYLLTLPYRMTGRQDDEEFVELRTVIEYLRTLGSYRRHCTEGNGHGTDCTSFPVG